MTSMKEKLDEVKAVTKRLREEYPIETNAFLGFLSKAESGPALDKKTKELINIGLAVGGQCEWCIAFHVEAAVREGATRDEIIEAGFMAVIMHGGPAYMYMVPLFKAVDEFLTEAR